MFLNWVVFFAVISDYESISSLLYDLVLPHELDLSQDSIFCNAHGLLFEPILAWGSHGYSIFLKTSIPGFAMQVVVYYCHQKQQKYKIMFELNPTNTMIIWQLLLCFSEGCNLQVRLTISIFNIFKKYSIIVVKESNDKSWH